jgi:NADH dehydrogenase FAD-containing subunit
MVDSPKQVLVVGSGFAGPTAALELHKHLDEHHRIVVLDRRADFTFIPSLVFERLTTRKRGRVMP